jgi:hypothetical protein
VLLFAHQSFTIIKGHTMSAFKPIYKSRLRSTAALTAALLALGAVHAEENEHQGNANNGNPTYGHTMYQRAHDAQSTPDSTQVLGSRQQRIQRWVPPQIGGGGGTGGGTDTGTGDTCQSSDCRSDGWQDVASPADDDSPADDSDDGTADSGDSGGSGG